MKTAAVQLSKICNDLRWLSSGPRCGLYEIRLPAMQPGSSIMPGKVNPSIPEMVNQVCFQVMGLDTTVAIASEHGQLELNVMMPVIAFNVLLAMRILSNAARVFSERCVRGIEANRAADAAVERKQCASAGPRHAFQKIAAVVALPIEHRPVLSSSCLVRGLGVVRIYSRFSSW